MGSNLCTNCETPLNPKQFKYCSNNCQQTFEWQLRKTKFELNGVWPDVKDGYAKSRHNKRYLLETRGKRCEICHTDNWLGKDVPLVLDHIDGDSSNDTLANLRLVCCNCDALLPTYKGRNRGNGRHARRERYAAGQSY